MEIQNKSLMQIAMTSNLTKYQCLIESLTRWIKDEVTKAHCKGAVLGVSGGIDSATLAFIAHRALGSKLKLYSIAINDKPNQKSVSSEHASLVSEALKLPLKNLDLSKTFKAFCKDLDFNETYVMANLKARLRMCSLYAEAQKNNMLVLGTDNLNEFYLGYFTKYGDGGCDLLPFANIKKSDVYIMAKILGVPSEIIHKAPSADLWQGQTDENELGFSYDDFESFYDDPNSVSPSIRKKIIAQHAKNEHKLVAIPKGPKLA